jgi:hypothetical protein
MVNEGYKDAPTATVVCEPQSPPTAESPINAPRIRTGQSADRFRPNNAKPGRRLGKYQGSLWTVPESEAFVVNIPFPVPSILNHRLYLLSQRAGASTDRWLIHALQSQLDCARYVISLSRLGESGLP